MRGQSVSLFSCGSGIIRVKEDLPDMKVGIVTFHDSDNYGAVFQAYALHKVVGHAYDCEIIDYRAAAISAENKLQRIREPKGLKGFLKKALVLRFYEKKHEGFMDFLAKCNISEPYTAQTIRKANKVYDAFITGSDQVFNLTLTHGDRNYLLEFADDEKLKIAYAASMGKYRFDAEDQKTRDAILRMNAVSCREPEVSQKVAEFTGRGTELVLDPTLLLEKERWLELEQEMRGIPEKYILLYCVSPEKWYFDLATSAGKKYGLPVLYVNYSPRRVHSPGIKNLICVTPGQFLYLIHHADIVLTSSFHGTALSTIYQKNLYIINDVKRKESNQRMDRLIDLYGLQKRFVSSAAEFTHDVFDYAPGARRVEAEWERSMKFLQEAGVLAEE